MIMLSPDEERLWAIGVVLVCILLFGAFAAYEILRPEKPVTAQHR